MALDFSQYGSPEDSGTPDFSSFGTLEGAKSGDVADRSWLDFGKDLGKSVVKGGISLAGDVGWLARKGVVDPIGRAVEGEANYVPNTDFEKATTGTAEMIGGTQSEKLQGQHQQVGKIMEQGGWDGFTAAAGYVLSNPSMIPALVAESAAPTAAIGKVGAGVLKAVGSRLMLSAGAETTVAGWSTGAAEGVQTLGNVGRQIEQKLDEKGITDPEARSLAMQQAIPAALVTMLAGRLGGGVEAKLFTDIGRHTESAAAKSAFKTVLKDMGHEGGEEITQSGGEQFFQNLGEGSAGLETDLSRGVGASAAIGGITGAAQGGGASAYRESINGLINSRRAPQEIATPPAAVLEAGTVDEAISAAESALDEPRVDLPSETDRAKERHHNVEFETSPTSEAATVEPFAVDGIPYDRPGALGLLDQARSPRTAHYDPDVADLQREGAPAEPPSIAVPGEPEPQSIPPARTTQQEYADALDKQSRGELLSSYERVLLDNPPATPAIEVAPERSQSVRGRDPATLTMRELELAARLTRSEGRRAQISAEIERRAQQEQADARAMEVPSNSTGGANVEAATAVSEGIGREAGQAEAQVGSAPEAPGAVNGSPVQATPTPVAAAPAPSVEPQVAPAATVQSPAVPEVAVSSESGNQSIQNAPQFRDYIAPKTVGEGARAIIKGSIRTFKTERAAAGFAKAQGLPQTWSPRDTGDGWVLSKPAADPVVEARPDAEAASPSGENRGQDARVEKAQGALDGRAQGVVGSDSGAIAEGRTQGGAIEPAREDATGRNKDAGVPPTSVQQAEVTKPRESGVSLSGIPPGLLKKITVEVQQQHDGEGVKTVQVKADQALADIDSEISAYEKLLECVRA